MTSTIDARSLFWLWRRQCRGQPPGDMVWPPEHRSGALAPPVLNTTTDAALFAIFGYTYGGSGTESFNLSPYESEVPLRTSDRTVVGATGGEVQITSSLSARDAGPQAHYYHLATHTAFLSRRTTTVISATLTHGQRPPTHAHGASTGAHSHTINDPGHAHGGTVRNVASGGWFSLGSFAPQIQASALAARST